MLNDIVAPDVLTAEAFRLVQRSDFEDGLDHRQKLYRNPLVVQAVRHIGVQQTSRAFDHGVGLLMIEGGKEPETTVLESEQSARIMNSSLAKDDDLFASTQGLDDDGPLFEGSSHWLNLVSWRGGVESTCLPTKAKCRYRPANPRMKNPIRFKLFIMMVLEFFIWGAWLPLIFPYMTGIGFDADQQAIIGSAFAIASVLGIFFSNQFADRNFSSERFMAFSHLVGGLAILGMFFTKSFVPFCALMLVHSLLYVPTISVANSLAFANLKNPTKEFGVVRMGGTIGWILASWPLFFILKGAEGDALIKAQSYIFVVAGVSSLLLAGFSLTLPHTPPKPVAAGGGEKLAWLEAVKFLKMPFILVLFLVTFLDATIHNGYFVMVGKFLGNIGIKPENIMPIMSIGQVAEILTMLVLGWFLAKLGWKTTMIIGILGHAARFAVFAFMPDNHAIIIAVQVLHGICYAFFFATVYIFIDAAFPKDVRASTQGLFNLLILGIGDLAAKWIFIPLEFKLTVDGAVDYRTLFLWPTGMALVAAILLAVFFNPPKTIAEAAKGESAPAH